MISTFKKVWKNCKNRHKSFLYSLLFSFLRSLFAVTQLLAILITIKVITGSLDIKKGIISIVVLTLICIIGNYITSYFEQINGMRTGFKMVSDKRIEMGAKLRKVPLGFFNTSSRSSTITTLTSALSGVENASTVVTVGIISGLFNALSLFIFMMIYDYRIGLIVGLGMIIYLILVNYQMKLSRKNAPKLIEAQNRLSNDTLLFLEGIKVTKSFSFKNGDTKLKESIDGSKDANIELTKKSMPTQYMASIIVAVFESLILLTTLLMFYKFNAIDLTKTVILVIFSFMAYASLNQAGSMLSMIGLLDSGLNEVERINDIKELETSEPIIKEESNEITFKNVDFSYGDNKVLHNVSFNIKPKSFTAIVGPSGSGKTTICELIARFRDVDSGEILFGNTNIKNIEYEDISKKVSMVFQRVYLFEDTILNNIRFAKPNASLDDVRQACKKAQCDDFIMSLKDGYDTLLTEGGSSLSGGEKQRISIARAILKDSPIIILDEATASIDPENEYQIQKAIEELTMNKTVIMIAHRLKTIKNADNIIVLEKGKIVQEGTHKELINEDGLYKKFINSRIKASKFTLIK